MHVKEQVREFVGDVKHRRETCSSFDSFDGASSCSGADAISHFNDSSSSSDSSVPSTPRRNRFIKFIQSRSPFNPSKKHQHNVLHKVRRPDGKRHRLFSAPVVPSERMVEPNHKQPVSYLGPFGKADERVTLGSSRADYSDVIDIRARVSGTLTPEAESTRTILSGGTDRDSLSESQPHFDTESHSDTCGTLVTGISLTKSASESDSRFDSVDLKSDLTIFSSMADISPPPPPPKSDQPEEMAPARPVSSSPSQVAPAPAPPTATPAEPIRSTSASPAPVYIPRLTAPTMFLPIPNVRLISPLSHSLLWWLAPKWSRGSRLSSSASIFSPCAVSPQLRRSRSHPASFSPLFPNLLFPLSPQSRQQ